MAGLSYGFSFMKEETCRPKGRKKAQRKERKVVWDLENIPVDSVLSLNKKPLRYQHRNILFIKIPRS